MIFPGLGWSGRGGLMWGAHMSRTTKVSAWGYTGGASCTEFAQLDRASTHKWHLLWWCQSLEGNSRVRHCRRLNCWLPTVVRSLNTSSPPAYRPSSDWLHGLPAAGLMGTLSYVVAGPAQPSQPHPSTKKLTINRCRCLLVTGQPLSSWSPRAWCTRASAHARISRRLELHMQEMRWV
jgi:hypothetical protein